MAYISEDGTVKTAINHDIIVKGKCIFCGKDMTDSRDGLYECFTCRAFRLRSDARAHLQALLEQNLDMDISNKTSCKIKELIKELED